MNWADREYAIGRGVAAMRHKSSHELQPFVRAVVEYGLPGLLAQATGSTFPNVSASQLADLWWPELKADEQRAIAHILGTLDDKIELNRRMSETLEAMARALYQSWFVDFDPVRAKAEGRDTGLPNTVSSLFPSRLEESAEGSLVPAGWRVMPLGEVVTLSIGGDWGSDVASEATVRVPCLRGVDLHRIRTEGWSEAPIRYVSASSLEKRSPSPSDLIVEGSGECGRSLSCDGLSELLGGPFVYSNFCKRLNCGTVARSLYVEYVLNAMVTSGSMKGFVTGTAMPNLDHKGLLSGLLIVVPPQEVLEVFAAFVSAARKRMYHGESRVLRLLRDALVPELVSGRLRVVDPGRFESWSNRV